MSTTTDATVGRACRADVEAPGRDGGATFPEIRYDDLLEAITSGRFDSFPGTFTPEVAAEVLREFNVHNRKESQTKIDDDARDMATGRRVGRCGQSVSFNVRSELDNGQNRLKACVKAGVPFPTLVVVGNAEGAFDVIDRGKKRTKADTISYHGHPNSSCVAAALGLLVRWQQGRLDRSYQPTEQEIMTALQDAPDVLHWAAMTSNLRARTGCAPGPTAFAMTLCGRARPGAARASYDRMLSGANLDEGDPVLVLRETTRARRSDKAKNGRDTQVAQAAVVIKAWNAYVDGRKISYLRYVDGEKFPVAK